uniref:Uncharacterized protein n=1 Tax=Chromera velia CCMP2878 TaxID=1169474 RepID=A0A0G4HGD5_9ALVE|eukprot:Cvel_27359.t1-p1 / transcript=Cvel_27359.t1 / gene=Cvel_27359 / organism=Chromera_velia_CCMP2878 / gene_product=hypothetical protein / transcript_product=hypothetical protein / location=Cvel_scaffold3399:16516-16989(-) / protein_length=158 / sequence_SO=supercontig / SO=protein_coding / is_pseudo=false
MQRASGANRNLNFFPSPEGQSLEARSSFLKAFLLRYARALASRVAEVRAGGTAQSDLGRIEPLRQLLNVLPSLIFPKPGYADTFREWRNNGKHVALVDSFPWGVLLDREAYKRNFLGQIFPTLRELVESLRPFLPPTEWKRIEEGKQAVERALYGLSA